MQAVIFTGGKQYLVEPGQTIKVPTLPAAAGQTVTFDHVLMVHDSTPEFGAPELSGAKVTAKVLQHAKAPKVVSVKFHNKVRYKRTQGHRQPYTLVKVEKILA